MKFLYGLLSGILITVIVYKWIFKDQRNKVGPEMYSDFKELSLGPATRYAEAANAEDKLRAAEAMYQKMMVLFLANLGLHLAPSKEVDVRGIGLPSQEPKFEDKHDDHHSCPACAPCNCPAADQKKAEAPKATTTQEKFKTSQYLDKMNSILRRLNGEFGGILRYTSGKFKGEEHGIAMMINLNGRGGKIDGSISVILSNTQGVVYSR